MAFPTGYSKYQEITIDHTKVPGDLTDFIVYVKLADLVKAGADIFDTCRTDGGDIRATKSDGSTELAVEVVYIDTTAKVGEIHIKFSGTLSSSSDTIIRIYYNGTDTLPAVTDTYGRNAVWSAYAYVYHFQHSSGNPSDSTASGNTLTNTNSVAYSTSGKLAGSAADGGSTNTSKYFTSSTQAVTLDVADNYFQSYWMKPTSSKNTQMVFMRDGSTEFRTGTRTSDLFWYVRVGTSTHLREVSLDYNDGNWRLLHLKVTSGTTMQGYINGATSGASVATSTFNGSGSNLLNIGGLPAYGDEYFTGLIDEVRIGQFSPSANWITTEYNNQNSPSTFYSVGAELGGSTIVSPSAQVATFSIPAYTIIRGVRLQATVQTATFSLPGETVRISARVNPTAQTATFSIPAYGISASAVVFNATAQVSTFTIPIYTILRGSVFSPDAQTVTFSVPSPVVATGNTVSPEPVVLTFTIPALAFIGALWRRSARSSADWTRSPINND